MMQIVDLLKRNLRLVGLIAVVVILIVVNFILFSGWQSAHDKQVKLENDVTRLEQNLTNVKDQYNLDKLQAQYDELSGTYQFPSVFPTCSLSAYLATGAQKYGIQLASVTPKGAVGTESLGGRQYTRNQIDMNISGSTTNMDAYLRYLEGGQQFPTLRLESVAFTPTGGTFSVIVLTQS